MGISVSVVVPVFNTKEWIGDCLQSLINQTIKFHEIIIVDDCSTDGSIDIIKKAEKEYGNISVYSSESNLGPGHARNLGLSKVSGDYVMFVDSDDILREDSIEILNQIISNERYEYDVLYYEADSFGMVEYVNSYDYRRGIIDTDADGICGPSFFNMTYPMDYYASPCLSLYRTDYLKNGCIEFPEGLFFEDEYFSFVSLQEAKHVGCINKSLYHRRYRKGSTMTSKGIDDRFKSCHKCFLLINSYISEKYQNFNSLIYCQYILDRYLVTLKYYDKLKKKPPLSQWEPYVNSFDDLLEKYGIDIMLNNYGILLTLWDILHYEKINNLDFHDGKITFEKLKDMIIRKNKEILEQLPFGDDKAIVGIYGKGRHTRGLIDAYNCFIGDIKSEVEYFTTDQITSNFTHLDYIIISSFAYRNEMMNNVRRCLPNVNTIDFYKNVWRDIFSDGIVLNI